MVLLTWAYYHKSIKELFLFKNRVNFVRFEEQASNLQSSLKTKNIYLNSVETLINQYKSWIRGGRIHIALPALGDTSFVCLWRQIFRHRVRGG